MVTGPMSRLDDRRAAVLRAIVSQYVRSGEPVGSKTIVNRFRLGVSAATVRNDMGALEDAGYIYQPHTSAGRVPTDAGYRYFVDSWASDVRLPAREIQRIKRFFGEPGWELEDALRRTAALLSSVTDHAAIVFAPALEDSIVRHVELVRISDHKAMIILVTDTGRVANHVMTIPTDLDDFHLDHATDMLNRLVVDVALDRAGATIAEALEGFPLELRDAVAAVARALDEELTQRETERLFLEGTSNIVDERKFADLETVRQVIGALEHRRLLLEVLADALASEKPVVHIGSENPVEEMQYCSVIVAPYSSQAHVLGSLAVIGPTRMDYRRSIAAVNEVSGALGSMLGRLGI